MMRWFKWFLVFLFILCALFGWWLSQAAVVQTQSGVYHSILLPLPGTGAVRLRAHAGGQAEAVSAVQLQGPIVWTTPQGAKVRWYCDKQAHQQLVPTGQQHINLNCLGQQHLRQWALATQSPVIDKQDLPTPQRVLVTSDLEGRLDYFRQWGIESGLLDAQGNWNYGAGHLVVVGDSVDRGRHVHDLLWYLYQLQQQARVARGELHLLLGNHEQYLFRGVIKDAEAEHLWATEQLVGEYKQAFAADTVIGQWLRQQPLLLRLNRTLFVHGGISETLLASGLSIAQLNELHRNVLSGKDQDSAHYELLFGSEGPTQFRGMTPQQQPMVSQAHLDLVKQQFDVDYLVIGHTKTSTLTPTYQGSLYLVENTADTAQSLQFIAGQPQILNTATLKPEHHYPQKVRPFSLLNKQDLAAFIEVWLVGQRSTQL